ncbi:MAG: nitric oxide synthase oxygenase [Paracoccaceae bacterium]
MVVDTPVRSSPLQRRVRKLALGERLHEAEAFVRRFHRENALGERACRARLAEVRRALRRRGSYRHTPEELAFGARVAWRNHARCIGRLHWQGLEVADCRETTDPDEMAGRIVRHLEEACNGGRIRSIVSVFAPIEGDRLPPYVESAQIVQYAGYVDEDGRRRGDARNAEATRIAMALGWRPPEPRGDFDLLPFCLRDTEDRRRLYEIPHGVVREVDIALPGAASAPRLRWYAVPVVSDMILTIGGIEYPCAPFNGFYMNTEIASRNFADPWRYDLLDRLARALGEDPDGDDTLWRDRTLTALNAAVLAAFRREGVSMVDHHEASAQYLAFERRERAQGREPSGDWIWIVPPQASAACPVFHVDMADRRLVPNFYRSRASDGADLRPDHSDEERGRFAEDYDAAWRRYYRWRRRRADR